MKMIGVSTRSAAMRSCTSRPLKSGSETSSTRQLGEEERGLARNSIAQANVCACQPAESISNSSDSRTEASSSTTKTIGVLSDADEKCDARSVAFDELGNSGIACDMMMTSFRGQAAIARSVRQH